MSEPDKPERADVRKTDPGDLARLARESPRRLGEALAGTSIEQQRDLALRLEPGARCEFLQNVPKPMRLVRSLPESELYLTIREIGPVDAVPLLALASAGQLRHLMDLEGWRGDRFDGDRAGAWAAMLLASGESTARRYLRPADDDELALLFHTWARVEQVEFDDQIPVHGSGETEAGNERGFVSPDGFHRFRPIRDEHAPAVRRIAEVLFADDPSRYQNLLWCAITDLPSEIEERALRWRQSRLEERGYPPWDEAIAVYAPPSGSPVAPPAIESSDVGTPRFPTTHLDDETPLAAAIATFEAADAAGRATLDSVLGQLAAVAARLVVADGVDTGDPAGHRAAGRKAAGALNIALADRLAGNERPEHALEAVAVTELFREGWKRVADVARQARTFFERGWPAGDAGALEWLDPPLGARVETLLLDRPGYLEIDASTGDGRAREFRSRAEIDETRGAVEVAETIGHLLVDALGVDLARVRASTEPVGAIAPTFSTLLATMLAWHAARGTVRLEPLPRDVVADFLRTVASRRTAAPDAAGRALDALLEALRPRVETPRGFGLIAGFGRATLERVAEECGTLDPGTPLDPRHVACLWVEGSDELSAGDRT